VGHALAGVRIAVCALASGLRVPGGGQHDSPATGGSPARSDPKFGQTTRHGVENQLTSRQFSQHIPGPPGIPHVPDSQPPAMQEDAGLELRPTEKDEICGSRLVP
jgi:hypothetical protein